MDAKRLVIGTLVGGVVMFGVGYLIWDVVFVDFFAANTGSATGVPREPNMQSAVALGTLSLAALVTLAVGLGAGPSSCALGFSWTLDCERVLAGGVSRWGNQIKNRRRRRKPEGNGVAERFIRTLKENLLWVRSFDTIEELRLALLEFKRTYNEQWMLEKYHYQSPAQVRRDFVGLDAAA